MSEPLDPMGICLSSFIPQTPAQQAFVDKVVSLVSCYADRLGHFRPTGKQMVSRIRKDRISDQSSCCGDDFVSWNTGAFVSGHADQTLFYDYYEGVGLFTILDQCPRPLEGYGHHYHLRHGGALGKDQGSLTIWKEFPVGVVLTGLESLLQSLETGDSLFAAVNKELDEKLKAMEVHKKGGVVDTKS